MSVSGVAMCNLSCHTCSSYFTPGNSSFHLAFTGKKNMEDLLHLVNNAPIQVFCHCLFSESLTRCLIKATLAGMSAPDCLSCLCFLFLSNTLSLSVLYVSLSFSLCVSFHPPRSLHTARRIPTECQLRECV